MESLEDNEYIAIQYPISVTNSNNQTIVISNNDQFEDVIEDAIDDCDDDSQSPGGNGNLSAILTDGILRLIFMMIQIKLNVCWIYIYLQYNEDLSNVNGNF